MADQHESGLGKQRTSLHSSKNVSAVMKWECMQYVSNILNSFQAMSDMYAGKLDSFSFLWLLEFPAFKVTGYLSLIEWELWNDLDGWR